jgi:hypothetical protein
MNDVEQWIYLDGPEPEIVQPFLDAVRDLPPATPEDRERRARVFFARLDAMLGGEAPAGGAEPCSPPAGLQPSHAEVAFVPWARGPCAVEPEPPEPAVAAPPAPAPPEPPVPPPPVRRAPAELAGTAEFPEGILAAAKALPFVRPEEIPPHQRATRTLQSEEEARAGLGGTFPLGDDSMQRALALLPFKGSPVVLGVVSFPDMTVHAYASFRAELAVRPERTEAILFRYHVPSRASREALDAHWQARFAAEPETFAEFERALAQFTEYVRLAQG